MRRFILFVLSLTILAQGAALAQSRELPAEIDTAKRYVFYMHGRHVERHGPTGDYDYFGILDAIEDMGFVAVGEPRGNVDIGEYSRMVAQQVRQLLDAGDLPGQITVGGHSKGGVIALAAAVRIANAGVKYAIFSSCGVDGSEFEPGYKRFAKKRAHSLQGWFVVAWAENDTVARDCDLIMKRAGVRYENKELASDKGHKLFYRPEPIWLDLLRDFASGDCPKTSSLGGRMC